MEVEADVGAATPWGGGAGAGSEAGVGSAAAAHEARAEGLRSERVVPRMDAALLPSAARRLGNTAAEVAGDVEEERAR